MNNNPLFTVVLPTTGDRGLLLPYSVGSVLKQTISSLELLIIGDGVSDDTKEAIRALEASDTRVRFFDYPKHLRRGEPYRHQVLTNHAKGRYVAYILDRDLWLPHHLETLEKYLQKGNFGWSHFFEPQLDGRITYGRWMFHARMTATAHTLDFYKQLPFGWRTTPPQLTTDAYMWDQFAAHPQYQLYRNADCTVLYFKRGTEYPGIPTHKRVEELKYWYELLENKEITDDFNRRALIELLLDHRAIKNAPLRVRGKTPFEFLKVLKTKLTLYKGVLVRQVKYAMKGHRTLDL
jgi:glycosyltransferase involved in cell wall biosynthesis